MVAPRVEGERSDARSLVWFFLVAYAVAWTSWFAAWASGGASGGHASPGLPMLFFFVAPFAPAIAALWLTERREGRAATGALLGRLFKWNVGLRWYVFALTYTAVIKLTAALIHRVAAGAWPRFGDEPWYLMLGATVLSTVILGQAGEEIGWRGYALPRLAARFGLARASIVLGVIWAVWHLPIFYMPGTDKFGQSFPLYLLQVVALSVALAWLYARTNGSLTLTMLLHAAVNNTKDIVPSVVQGAGNPFALSSSLLAWITLGLLWLAAAFFLVEMSRIDLRTILASRTAPSN